MDKKEERNADLLNKFGHRYYELCYRLKEANLLKEVMDFLLEINETEQIDFFIKIGRVAVNEKLITDDGNQQTSGEEYIFDDLKHAKAHEHDSEDNPQNYELVKFSNLKKINEEPVLFKEALLKHVNSQGGLKSLSEKTSLSVSSLSRFFNSNSKIRKKTVMEIGEALKINYVYIHYR